MQSIYYLIYNCQLQQCCTMFRVCVGVYGGHISCRVTNPQDQTKTGFATLATIGEKTIYLIILTLVRAPKAKNH